MGVFPSRIALVADEEECHGGILDELLSGDERVDDVLVGDGNKCVGLLVIAAHALHRADIHLYIQSRVERVAMSISLLLYSR